MPKSVITTRPSLRDEHVVRLQIAMHDARRVRRREPRADRARRSRRPRRSGAVRRARGAAPSDSPSTNSIVRNRSPSCSPMSNVRATFLCVTRRASFTSWRKRSSISGCVDELAAQHLQRDDLVELRVARAIDGAHPADAEQPEQLVATCDARLRSRGALHRGAFHKRLRREESAAIVAWISTSGLRSLMRLVSENHEAPQTLRPEARKATRMRLVRRRRRARDPRCEAVC